MSRRILVAEPSRTLTTLIRLTLAAEGVELEFVADGQAAMERARARPPDVLIADAHLPGLDGYAVAEALRRDPSLASVAVLLTIADYETPDVSRLAQLEVEDILTKPFERNALAVRVRALLDAVAAPAALQAAEPEGSKSPTPTPRSMDGSPPLEPDGVAALVDEAVKRHLPQAIEAALTDTLAQITAPQLEAAIDSAVARNLPDVLEHAAFGLGPSVEQQLRELLPDLIAERAEAVVWKVVPELAEDLIKAEIERLTRAE